MTILVFRFGKIAVVVAVAVAGPAGLLTGGSNSYTWYLLFRQVWYIPQFEGEKSIEVKNSPSPYEAFPKWTEASISIPFKHI